jgi:pyruvate ferredoxin oxidoreductase beta subunit
VLKARDMKGTRYIHVYTPCSPGWTFPAKNTVKVGKAAVDTGAVVLYEIERGQFRLTAHSATLAKRGALKPLTDYLSLQGRFKGLAQSQAEELQEAVTRRWNGFLERAAKE